MSKNKEEIIEIIEKTREETQKKFNEIHTEQTLQKIIINQAIAYKEELSEKEQLIHFYNSEIEAIYNYLIEERE